MATNNGFEANNQDVEGGVAPHNNEPPPAYLSSYGTSEAAPPPYPAISDDAPPSYDSLFGELQAAKENSSSVGDFFKKFMVILLSTVGCTICVALVLAVPVSMIVIGAIYVHDCPRQSYIPIYLIVGGCFGVIKNLMNIGQRIKNRQENQEDENAKTNPLDGTLNCFLVAWFIAGNVWIYSIHGDYTTDNPDASDYCHPTLYQFAFWITTASYIMVGFLCCSLCCVGICASLFKKSDSN